MIQHRYALTAALSVMLALALALTVNVRAFAAARIQHAAIRPAPPAAVLDRADSLPNRGFGLPRSGTAPTISVGSGPVGEADDAAAHTLYVANTNDNTVSVINTAACNATDTDGCGSTPTTVTIGNAPLALAIDRSSHTLYVANAGGELPVDARYGDLQRQ